MTQPAKVQEPSMEEILASIRRIIADDEAKPAAAAPAPAAPAPKPEPVKAVAPAAKAPAMSPPPPSAPPVAKAAPPPPPPPPPAAPAADASNNQDDIDALLAGLDGSTTEEEIRPAPPEAAPPEEEEVFDLTDDMALPDLGPPLESDVVFAEAARREIAPPEPEPSWDEALTEAAPPPPVSHAPPPASQMLSHSTVAAVESAFNSLAHTVLSNNARTLEDLVKEMLRPMLKSWLDDNLPQLVERIVKAEIERVSRGR